MVFTYIQKGDAAVSQYESHEKQLIINVFILL